MKRRERRTLESYFVKDLRRASHVWAYMDRARIIDVVREQIEAKEVHLMFRAKFATDTEPRWFYGFMAVLVPAFRSAPAHWLGLALLPDTAKMYAAHGTRSGMGEIDPREAELFTRAMTPDQLEEQIEASIANVFEMLGNSLSGINDGTDLLPEVGVPKPMECPQ